MSYFDRLRPAKINDFEFLIESDDVNAVGRRLAVQSVIGRPEPVVQDLGRNAQQFSIQGYLIGNDYDLKHDALIQLLEQKGSKQLQHPHLGDYEVHILPVGFNSTRDKGGYCSFTLQCIIAAEIEIKTRIDNSSAAANAEKELLKNVQKTAQNKFETPRNSLEKTILDKTINSIKKHYRIADTSSNEFSEVIDNATQTIENLNSEITKAQTKIVSKLKGFERLERSINQLFGSLQTPKTTNERTLIDYVLVLSITHAFPASREVQYTTQAEVDAQRERLQMLTETAVNLSINNASELLNAQRLNDAALLEIREQALPTIKIISEKQEPFVLSVFKAHGNISRLDQTRKQNPRPNYLMVEVGETLEVPA